MYEFDAKFADTVESVGNIMAGSAIYGTVGHAFRGAEAIAGKSRLANSFNSAGNVPKSGSGGKINNNSKDFLNEALRLQNLKTPPNKLKQSWVENGYKYEVRIHPGEPQYTNAKLYIAFHDNKCQRLVSKEQV